MRPRYHRRRKKTTHNNNPLQINNNIQPPPKNANRNIKKECDICCEMKKLSQFKKIANNCNHPANTCSECIAETLDEILDGEIMSGKISYAAIPCINSMHGNESPCPGVFDAASIKEFLYPEQFEQWSELVFQEWAEKQADFRWCALPNCGAGQLVEDGKNSSSYFTCVKCARATCVEHRVPFHEGLTCEEYSLSGSKDELAVAFWKAKRAKPCPHCKAPIEKNGGCDHMTCRKCGNSFAWGNAPPFPPILTSFATVEPQTWFGYLFSFFRWFFRR